LFPFLKKKNAPVELSYTFMTLAEMQNFRCPNVAVDRNCWFPEQFFVQ